MMHSFQTLEIKLRDFFKGVVLRGSPKFLRTQFDLNVRTRGTHDIECPICGFFGIFRDFGTPPRLNALCPSCGSLERHRQFYLFFFPDKLPNKKMIRPTILHFAAEPVLERIIRPIFGVGYKTADLTVKSDLEIDITDMNLDSNSISTIICMHVLEHVDDKKALAELFRVLSKGAFLILAFPIIEKWESTYENLNVKTDKDRLIHFGQVDHVKYYGKDVRLRIQNQGFQIENEFVSSPEMCIKYGLQRGETLFLCKKP